LGRSRIKKKLTGDIVEAKDHEFEILQQSEHEKAVHVQELSQQVIALKQKCKELGMSGKGAVAAVTKHFAEALAKAQQTEDGYFC